MVIPLFVHSKSPLYSACRDWILLFQPLTTFVWPGCPCQPFTGLPVTQPPPPPLICAGRATRQKRLFCLFACRGTLICYDVSDLSFFLSLIACTQWSQLIFASFGQYVILARHFPQKNLSKNPKIGFPLSPPPDHALLPLTHDLTTSCIGWVQAGEIWALHVLHFHVCPKSVCYSCIRRGLETCLHILPPILAFLWHEPFSGFSFFRACSLRTLGFCLIMGFSSFSPFSCSFLQSLHFLQYRSDILVVVLFDPSLLGLFRLIAYSSLNDSIQSFGLFGYIACGLLCPIFLLSILNPFTFLGHPQPFLVLCSYGLLLTPLGFLGPITLSFILRAHGLSINPLLSLLSLLRACCGPFSLFYIIYCPWVFYFSLSGLLQVCLLPQGPFVYFMSLRSIILAAWV